MHILWSCQPRKYLPNTFCHNCQESRSKWHYCVDLCFTQCLLKQSQLEWDLYIRNRNISHKVYFIKYELFNAQQK